MNARAIGYTVLMVFAALAAVPMVAYLSTGLGWAVKPAELLNADRVQRVRTEFIDRAHQLDGLRSQRDAAKSAAEIIKARAGEGRWSVQDRADYDSVARTATDLSMAYTRACAQYNADWDNTYKTIAAVGLDLPTRCDQR